MKPALWSIAFLFLGCTNDNVLSGSLSEIFDLAVSRVELAANSEALQVTYLVNKERAVDVVAQVTVSLKDITVKPGTRIQLAGEYAPGHPRCVVIHAPAGEPSRRLPSIKKGDMVISNGGFADTKTDGNFSLLFADEGGDLGFGRTLSGQFNGFAADAGFGILP